MTSPVPPGFEPDDVVTAPPTVRAVPDPTMQAAIDGALARLEPEEKGAVVGYADLNAAQLVVMARLEAGWSFVGIVQREWATKDVKAGAEVRFSWR